MVCTAQIYLPRAQRCSSQRSLGLRDHPAPTSSPITCTLVPHQPSSILKIPSTPTSGPLHLLLPSPCSSRMLSLELCRIQYLLSLSLSSSIASSGRLSGPPHVKQQLIPARHPNSHSGFPHPICLGFFHSSSPYSKSFKALFMGLFTVTSQIKYRSQRDGDLACALLYLQHPAQHWQIADAQRAPVCLHVCVGSLHSVPLWPLCHLHLVPSLLRLSSLLVQWR